MWLKSIVSELEPKNKIFVRKRAPSWFFAFAGVKKLFFLIFLSETVILDKFWNLLACIRVSPRNHPCTWPPTSTWIASVDLFLTFNKRTSVLCRINISLILEELSRRAFFQNYLGTFLNDGLYAQTKVFAKESSIFENSGRGRPKNDDYWHFREQIVILVNSS